MSVEEAIWGAEAASRIETVRDRVAIAPAIPDNFYDRCGAHQITHCMVCAMKERTAKEVSAATQPVPTLPVSQTVLAQPMPFLSATTVVPAPEPVPKPQVVALAETFAAAVRKLETEQKLLIASEARVEMLTVSIAELKVAVETARHNLATLVASGEQHDWTEPAVQPIDLNSASNRQLESLPGITSNEAHRIAHSRPYHDKRALVTDGVISESSYRRIKDRVTVN